MLISALCSYYNTLAEGGRLGRTGFSRVAVRYRILLTPDGELAAIEPCLSRDPVKNKKGETVYKDVPTEFIMPKRTEKPAIDNNIPEHRPLYIFGLDVNKGEFTETGDKNKAMKSHESFVKKTLEFTEGMTSELARAYRAFAENWVPSENKENPILTEIIKDFNKSGYCFALFGHPEKMLHDDEELISAYLREISSAPATDEITGICAVTGEEEQPIVPIHGNLRGIRGGQSSGTKLVCFNNPADESYGKSQSVNSSISVAAAEKYVEALNYLLRESGHHTHIDDLTMVYWADCDNAADSAVCDIFSLFCLSGKSDRAETDNRLSAVMAKLRTGTVSSDDLAAEGIDPSVNFYVAGLTPNSSRVSQKFFYRNSVGKFAANIAMHQRDLLHSGLDKDRQLTVGALINSLYSPTTSASDRKPPYPLYAALMESILNGTRYPQSLLGTVVMRCKTDKSISDTRIALIKACLNRKARLMNKQEVISMALDTENKGQAYVCGRIFALLEIAQEKAAGKVKLDRTIKDAYFSSACSKPSTVLPRLLQLAQHHFDKLDDANRIRIDKILTEAMDKIDGKFPSSLSLDEQGEFIVGYYQQKKGFYTKAEVV